MIHQREVGTDTGSYGAALRAALREDPDIILVGEMRDLDTISIALTAAETGHLVFSTLHTIGGAKTIDRVIDVFPPHQQQQVRVQLSTVLQAVISQQLIPTADGKGRVCVCEIMTCTPALRNLIREAKTPQINNVIATSRSMGMIMMDHAIAEAVRSKKITSEEALEWAVDAEALTQLVRMR
jgi:twitching motility protein PilT